MKTLIVLVTLILMGNPPTPPTPPTPPGLDTVCHNGREIVCATPAILAAHLAHGDCLGLCADCITACCLPGAVCLMVAPAECDEMGGISLSGLCLSPDSPEGAEDPCDFSGGD